MDVIILLINLAIMVGWLAGMWKALVKAGQPGWACLVPIYNIIILLRVVDKPWWWLLLLFIPLVNFVVAIYVVYLVSKRFGGGIGMTLLLLFLPFVAWPMLGFGSATYTRE